MKNLVRVLGVIVGLLSFSWALADPQEPQSKPAVKKQIDFEESVIENVQRKNLDYVTLPGSRGSDGKIRHLYKKRADFDDKTKTTLQDLEVSP